MSDIEPPYIVAVDDDPQVMKAVSRDLRHRYRPKYRVMSSDSPEKALDDVRALERRGNEVALFVVDQRMPKMNGVEFLVEALRIFPDARRVLLTAYADSDAAIQAINRVNIDYYLSKPWDPPEDHLYPILDDLLDQWYSFWQPPFRGWRVIGHRWSPPTHELTDFLSRNQVKFEWTDVEAEPEKAERLLASEPEALSSLPAVITADGDVLRSPDIAEIAQRLGMANRPSLEFYDLVIIGGGPAGLAAAVYGASEGLKTVVVEKDAPGGQAGTSSLIENYLGFPTGLAGSELTRRAVLQAEKFGVEFLKAREATKLAVDGAYRIVTLDDGTRLLSHAVLIATGLDWRRLDVPGIERLQGAGIYYGATAGEARNYAGQDVVLIGGANSAGQAAMNFAQYARSVCMLVRGASLSSTMSQYLAERIEKADNIQVCCNSQVVGVDGADHLESLTVRCNGDTRVQACGGLYVFIGAQPRTEWLRGILTLNETSQYVLSGADLPRKTRNKPRRTEIAGWPLERDPYMFETIVPGVFVAGDVRCNSIKRVASAVGEGSACVMHVHQYLSGLR